MRVLGIIPARGGSKGIKKKNIIKIGNKPLIEYTIDQCLKSKKLSRFIVSTDDEEIAKISSNLGAEIPFMRPEILSNDTSSSFSVIKHTAEFFLKKDEKYNAYMLLQPTTPFRTSALIDDSINLLEQKPNASSVISLVNVGANHPHRMYSLDQESKMFPLIKGDFDPMEPRQKLPNYYIRSGDIYLTTFETLFQENSLIGSKPIGIKVNPNNAINIDTQNDLELARIYLRAN